MKYRRLAGLVSLSALVFLSSCGPSQSLSEAEPIEEERDPVLVIGDRGQGRQVLEDGDYQATAQGLQGPLTVEVRIVDGFIDRVQVVDHEENPGVVEAAFEDLAQEIVKNQSARVDAVTGATEASQAMIQAVGDCLRQAERSR